MHTLKSATEKTITCPECGFKWHRSGGRGNQAFKLEPKEPRSLTASYPEVRSDHHHVNSFRTAPSLCADMIFGKDRSTADRTTPSPRREATTRCMWWWELMPCPGVELFEAERPAVIGVRRLKSLFDER